MSKKSRALTVMAAVVVLAAAAFGVTGWDSYRGDYRQCRAAAASIHRGDSRARAMAVLSRYRVVRNDGGALEAICTPADANPLQLPLYPVMALEIDVAFDGGGLVAEVTTGDGLLWVRKNHP